MIRMAHLRQQRSEGKLAESSGPNISGFDVGSKAEREERCMRCGGRSHGTSSDGQVESNYLASVIPGHHWAGGN